MEPKVIESREEYHDSLRELERLMDLQPEPGSSEWDRLQLFSTLIEVYESNEFDFEVPDPIDAILYRMEEQGLRQKDLVPYIGSKSKVSEILSRKRPLTLPMIRKLHDGLHISLEALVGKGEKAMQGWETGGGPALCVAEDSETPIASAKRGRGTMR